MLTKMQANKVIRGFMAEEPDSSPREWICQIDIIGKKDMLHVYVGSIVKNKFKKIYRASNMAGVIVDVDDFNKAVGALIPSFIAQVHNKAFEICATLAGHDLDFKGHEIKISEIDDNGSVTFDYKGAGKQTVTQQIFAKNFVLGNIKIK